MKKVIFALILLILLCGCKSDESLNCDSYPDNDEKCLVFLYKDNCKYCVNDYYYVNRYNDSNAELKIYSYKLKDEEKSFKGVEIVGVPSLVLIENNEVKIVAKGYIQVKRYLNNLM